MILRLVKIGAVEPWHWSCRLLVPVRSVPKNDGCRSGLGAYIMSLMDKLLGT